MYRVSGQAEPQISNKLDFLCLIFVTLDVGRATAYLNISNVFRVTGIKAGCYDNSILFLFAVNPMAHNELWIIADADNADKMLKFHELRNLATTEKQYEQWYLFKNFDIITQTAKHFGNTLVELEMGLNKTLQDRRRAPHSELLLVGDSILEDEVLAHCHFHVKHVLMELCKQMKRMMQKWVSFLPSKATPLNNVQFFINKPVLKPESFFTRRNDKRTYHMLASRRNSYNSQLIRVVHELGFKFINPGISSQDAALFEHTRNHSFKLSPRGLTVFWESLSDSLDKLHTSATVASRDSTPREPRDNIPKQMQEQQHRHIIVTPTFTSRPFKKGRGCQQQQFSMNNSTRQFSHKF